MSRETEAEVSGWTTDTLLTHLLTLLEERDRRYGQRFDDQNAAVSAALAAAEKAVVKAETATERRFEGVNEFRNTLADQARDLMPRKESEQLHQAAAARLDALERRVDKREARSGGITDYRGYLIGAAGLLIGGVGLAAALLR